MKCLTAVLATIAVLATPPRVAQAADALVYGGVKSALWSGNRSLDQESGVVAVNAWLTGKVALSPGIGLRYEGWLYAESDGHEPFRTMRTRQAFYRVDAGDVEWRFGWQIFAWGRGDRINPTDNVSAKDFHSLVATDDEQRFGSPAVTLNWLASETVVVQALAKRFDASIMPSAWRERSLPIRADRSGASEVGVRVDSAGGVVDWSVSWFRGYDKQRSLAINSMENGLVREYPSLRAVGADAAASAGAWNFRTEWAAVSLGENQPAALGGKRSYVAGLFGVERTLGDAATFNVQIFANTLSGPSPGDTPSPQLTALLDACARANGQFYRKSGGFTFRYAQYLANDTVFWELPVVVNVPGRDYAVRPRLTWQVDDHYRVSVGADVFRGRQQSVYGVLRDNSAVFAEVGYAI